MYARVITFQYQPGKIDEALQIFRESVLPEMRQQAGFQGATMLADRGNNKVVGITLWQTEADLQKSLPSGQERFPGVSSHFAVAPIVETYEVAVQEV